MNKTNYLIFLIFSWFCVFGSFCQMRVFLYVRLYFNILAKISKLFAIICGHIDNDLQILILKSFLLISFRLKKYVMIIEKQTIRDEWIYVGHNRNNKLWNWLEIMYIMSKKNKQKASCSYQKKAGKIYLHYVYFLNSF